MSCSEGMKVNLAKSSKKNCLELLIEITKTIIPANVHTPREVMGVECTWCMALIWELAGLEVHQCNRNSYID